MSLFTEINIYTSSSMRKTKKRTTAATKLQALVRGRHTRHEQQKKAKAAAKLQALARGKRARRIAAKKKKKKQRTTKSKGVKGRTAYKSYLASYTEDNTDKIGGHDGLHMLRDFTSQIKSSLSKHGGLKIHISSTGLYRKSGPNKGANGLYDDKYHVYIDNEYQMDYNKLPDDKLAGFWHTTHIVQITNDSQINKALKELGDRLIERVENQELNGSGWVFVRFKNFEIHIARFKPLKGSSWFDLPQKLKLKKAIVNVQNTDEQCFKWAVLAAVFPVQKHAQRVSKYTDHEADLDWSGLTFPVTLPDILKFERRNQISINVYGWEEKASCYF